MLVMYTDGVTESMDNQGLEFGERRLLALVAEGLAVGQAAQTIADSVLTDIRTFVGDAPQFDDITLVVLQRGLALAGNAKTGPGLATSST